MSCSRALLLRTPSSRPARCAPCGCIPSFSVRRASRPSLATDAQKPRYDSLHPQFRTRAMSSGAASAGGYEAFGSFHTPSAADMFANDAPAADTDVSDFLPALPSAQNASEKLQFKDNVHVNAHNRDFFALDLRSWTYLNHGAFGAPTRFAARTADAWRARADAQPLSFHDRDMFPHVVHAIKALAAFAGASQPEKLVLLPNATAGLHAVLSSVLSSPGLSEASHEPVVVCFSTRYGAVRKMLRAIQDSQGKRIHVHEEPLPLLESYDDKAVLERLERALQAALSAPGRRVALVVVDHITSNTAVTLPVKQIVQRCHEHNSGRIPVLVDGAHALLNLPLSLDDVAADYYVGNCHKWFCSARGAAFLHVDAVDGPIINPRVVSHGFFDGLQSAFMWTGLQDYSAWLALPHCLDFWRFHGVDQARKYMHTLAQDAAELLYTRWRMPTHLERERRVPSHKRHAMRLVQLPTARTLAGGVIVNEVEPAATSTDAKRVQDALHFSHRIEVPVKCVDGRLYVRLSAHVYNCLEDFEKLAVAATSED